MIKFLQVWSISDKGHLRTIFRIRKVGMVNYPQFNILEEMKWWGNDVHWTTEAVALGKDKWPTKAAVNLHLDLCPLWDCPWGDDNCNAILL